MDDLVSLNSGRLCVLRGLRGVDIPEMAKRTRIRQDELTAYIEGTTPQCARNKLVALARYFGVPPEWLSEPGDGLAFFDLKPMPLWWPARYLAGATELTRQLIPVVGIDEANRIAARLVTWTPPAAP